MIRKPNAKAQAEILMNDLAGMGFNLQRGKALDLVAKLEGYRGWNEFSKAQKDAEAAAPAPAETADEKALKYAFDIPQALFDKNNEVSDDHLAVFLEHQKDQVSVLLQGVTGNGDPGAQSVPFAAIAVGEQFFDPSCGEDFIKTSDATARMCIAEEDDPDDTFEATDEVERNVYSLQLCGHVRFKVTNSGGVYLVHSREGLTDDMSAILANAHPDSVESVDNAWFEWVDAYGESVGEPFADLPANPKDAVEKYLKPYLPEATLK